MRPCEASDGADQCVEQDSSVPELVSPVVLLLMRPTCTVTVVAVLVETAIAAYCILKSGVPKGVNGALLGHCCHMPGASLYVSTVVINDN